MLLNVNFKSYILGMDCNANVILPQSEPGNIIKKPFKTLYLLHGLSDDHSSWTDGLLLKDTQMNTELLS